MSNVKTVYCPSCQKPVTWEPKNEYRPFCSQRCKLIDFGAWATEQHSIPGESFYPVEEDDDSEDSLQ